MSLIKVFTWANLYSLFNLVAKLSYWEKMWVFSLSIADGTFDKASGTVLNLANGSSKTSCSSGIPNVILIRVHCDT